MTRDRGRLRWADALCGSGSLGGKLVLILTGVGIAGAIGIALMLAAVITPSFDALEARAVAGQVARTKASLDGYAAKVETAAREVTEGHNDGRAVARWVGADGGNQGALAVFARHVALAELAGSHVSAHGYARIGSVVAAVGVVTRDGHYVVQARTITPRCLGALLGIGAQLAPASGDRAVITSSGSRARIALPILGIDGHAVASVRFAVPRDVSRLGRRLLLLAVAGSTSLLLLVLMVLRRTIERLVLRPLDRIESHMERVRVSGAMSVLPEDQGADEIGALGRSFNAMLSQLVELRAQVEAQSYVLGRSESAVAVMHNVRNALNPITTILSHGIAQPPPIDRATVARAIGELAREDMAAARRQQLAAFVAAVIEEDDTSREATRSELQVARAAMGEVLEIIGQQQAQAHERPPVEPCDVIEIVARNAAIARYAPDASIAFSYPADVHLVLGARVIFSQVIGNLFANAVEAIVARGTGNGSIAVTVDEQGDQLVIAIRDDGEGFDAATGASLFQRGASTRAHKAGGLGLHWCANAVNAMGGSLQLESAGRGQGATATLILKRPVTTALAEAA